MKDETLCNKEIKIIVKGIVQEEMIEVKEEINRMQHEMETLIKEAVERKCRI